MMCKSEKITHQQLMTLTVLCQEDHHAIRKTLNPPPLRYLCFSSWCCICICFYPHTARLLSLTPTKPGHSHQPINNSINRTERSRCSSSSMCPKHTLPKHWTRTRRGGVVELKRNTKHTCNTKRSANCLLAVGWSERGSDGKRLVGGRKGGGGGWSNEGTKRKRWQVVNALNEIF